MRFVLEIGSYAGIRKKKIQKLIHAFFIAAQFAKNSIRWYGKVTEKSLKQEHILKTHILYIWEVIYSTLS